MMYRVTLLKPAVIKGRQYNTGDTVALSRFVARAWHGAGRCSDPEAVPTSSDLKNADRKRTRDVLKRNALRKLDDGSVLAPDEFEELDWNKMRRYIASRDDIEVVYDDKEELVSGYREWYRAMIKRG